MYILDVVWHYTIFLANTNSVKKINNTIRIIGGLYRGKKISFPSADGLRPTSDRIRETLFNWLMHDIHDSSCLDLFAGSGALGFEAYSRGADQVVLIEKNPIIYNHLKTLAASFQTNKLSIIQISAAQYLQTQPARQFDIVFIDPPFAHPELFDCIRHFEESDWLKPQGLLYVESPHALPLNPKFWQLLKAKTAGQLTYALYQKISSGFQSAFDMVRFE